MEAAPMRLAYVALLLGLLTGGCASRKPDRPVVSEPRVVATPPGTPEPVAMPAAPAAPQPPAAAASAPSERPPPLATGGKARPPVANAPGAAPPLDLKTLTERLKDTQAIGFFTKITLKNQVDNLLDQFREYYQGKATFTVKDLRRSYDLLMMKVLSLLQDEDQKLASDIVSSREAIWGLLADPKTFATLKN
jgi:hypothetical protein